MNKLAKSGCMSSQYKLAKIYYWGRGVDKDLDLATTYYYLSAKQKYSLAEKNLLRLANDDGYKPAIDRAAELKLS